MFLSIINCILLNNNNRTCKSKCFERVCVVIFYILSIVEMIFVLSIDKIRNNHKDSKIIQFITYQFVPFIILGIDILVNGILLLRVFKILLYIDEPINTGTVFVDKIVPNKKNFKNKLFKIKPTQSNDIESSDIESGNIEASEIELTIINNPECNEYNNNNDENQECPICYQKSDEYYIYHFFDNFPEDKKYKPGCLKNSHFICKNCANNKLINLNKCVLCNEYYNN